MLQKLNREIAELKALGKDSSKHEFARQLFISLIESLSDDMTDKTDFAKGFNIGQQNVKNALLFDQTLKTHRAITLKELKEGKY